MSALRSRKDASATRTAKPDLKVVTRRRSKRLIKRAGARKLAPLTVLAVIAIGGIIAGVLLEQVVLAQSAFKLTEIRRDLTAAEENREVLMLEAAKLDSAARIERYARESLGMVDPAPENIRYIVADIRSGTRTGEMVATSDRPRTPGAAGRAALGMADAP